MGLLAYLRSFRYRLPMQATMQLTPREELLRAAHYSEWPLTRYEKVASLRLAHEFIRHELENLGYRRIKSKPPQAVLDPVEGNQFIEGEITGARDFRQTWLIVWTAIALLVAGLVVAPFWGPAFFIGTPLGIVALYADRLVNRSNQVTAAVQYLGVRQLAPLSVPATLHVLGQDLPPRTDLTTVPPIYDGRPVPFEIKIMMAVDAKRVWLKDLVTMSASALGTTIPEALARSSLLGDPPSAPDSARRMPILVAGSNRQYETRFPLGLEGGNGAPANVERESIPYMRSFGGR